jgi:hypothetical protein
MNRVALALQEEWSVEKNPILEEGRTVGLHEEVNLSIVGWSRGNKEYEITG